MITYISISLAAILAALVAYLLIRMRRLSEKTAFRIQRRYEKQIKDQEDEISRLNYLYNEQKGSCGVSAASSSAAQGSITSSVSIQTAEGLLMEQRKLEADKEDLAMRNRKLWDMSIQIQKDRQRIQLLKNEIEAKHKGIQDSIIYAKRIQDAVVPREDILSSSFSDHFLLWLPKETVSGDFYWMKREGDTVIFAIADCTGHGVPGAFMSMMGVTFLNEICAHMTEDVRPSDILEQLRSLVIETLKQDNANPLEPKDGMDMALCVLNLKTRRLLFSGANNPLYLVRNGELQEYKGVRCPVGLYPKLKPFETTEIQAMPGDYLYMFSDGFADQFNGNTGKKVTYMRFKQLLVDTCKTTAVASEQSQRLRQFLEEWRAGFVQMDDVLIGGYRL